MEKSKGGEPGRKHEWAKWAIVPGGLLAILAAEETLRRRKKSHGKEPAEPDEDKTADN